MNSSSSQIVQEKQVLTKKQQAVLDFLREYVQEYGFPPTMKEIGDRFSFASTNAVTQYLVALERKGYIRRATKGASRGIQIVDFTPQAKTPVGPANNSAPTAGASASFSSSRAIAPMLHHQWQSVKNVIIVGEGSAQNPLSAFLSPRGQIKIDVDFFAPEAAAQSGGETPFFAALVGDDAMSAEGIREGDVVIAKQQFHAAPGDIVVALFHDALLVRRFMRVGAVSELEAATKTFPPISFQEGGGAVAIIGVVLGQMRAL
jgi:repressor LexA